MNDQDQEHGLNYWLNKINKIVKYKLICKPISWAATILRFVPMLGPSVKCSSSSKCIAPC